MVRRDQGGAGPAVWVMPASGPGAPAARATSRGSRPSRPQRGNLSQGTRARRAAWYAAAPASRRCRAVRRGPRADRTRPVVRRAAARRRGRRAGRSAHRDRGFPDDCLCSSVRGGGWWARGMWCGSRIRDGGERCQLTASWGYRTCRRQWHGSGCGQAIRCSSGPMGWSTRDLLHYVRSREFSTLERESKRNYATDTRLLLEFLSSRGVPWRRATERDLRDYRHWRCVAPENPERISGAKWDREEAAFTKLFRWGQVRPMPVDVSRRGDRAADSVSSRVSWLTPRTWGLWSDVGLRGLTPAGLPAEALIDCPSVG